MRTPPMRSEGSRQSPRWVVVRASDVRGGPAAKSPLRILRASREKTAISRCRARAPFNPGDPSRASAEGCSKGWCRNRLSDLRNRCDLLPNSDAVSVRLTACGTRKGGRPQRIDARASAWWKAGEVRTSIFAHGAFPHPSDTGRDSEGARTAAGCSRPVQARTGRPTGVSRRPLTAPVGLGAACGTRTRSRRSCLARGAYHSRPVPGGNLQRRPIGATSPSNGPTMPAKPTHDGVRSVAAQ